jgi:hypothetical protein
MNKNILKTSLAIAILAVCATDVNADCVMPQGNITDPTFCRDAELVLDNGTCHFSAKCAVQASAEIPLPNSPFATVTFQWFETHPTKHLDWKPGEVAASSN